MGLDGKIQALNNAIKEAIPHMRTVVDERPNAKVLEAISKMPLAFFAKPSSLLRFDVTE